MPVSLFGAAMGLGGLGLASRAANEVLGVPRWLDALWVAAGAIVLGLLLVVYVYKWIAHAEAARAELVNPAQLGFAATLPLALCIVAGGLGPYVPGVAQTLWWAGYTLLVITIVGALVRWLQGGIELAQVNTGWMLALVSGVVIPVAGVPLGHLEASRVIYAIGLVFAPLVIGLVFVRMVVAPPLPPGLRPTWAIYVVPAAMIYLNYAALSGTPAGMVVEGVYFVAWVFAIAILIASRDCLSWPTTPAWWAFTFPADALAGASIRYAAAHPNSLTWLIAWVAFAAATVIVICVIIRTLVALGRGILFIAPGHMPMAPTQK